MNPSLPTVPALARQFCFVLRDTLSPTQMAKVVRRNAAQPDPSICHSHDFCDANMAMAEAWEMLSKVPCGADCPEEGLWSEPAVMVDGVPHWKMGDGYMWERVSLQGGEIYSANGQPILRESIPLTHQAAIIQAACDGQSMGPLVVDGVTYDWS